MNILESILLGIRPFIDQNSVPSVIFSEGSPFTNIITAIDAIIAEKTISVDNEQDIINITFDVIKEEAPSLYEELVENMADVFASKMRDATGNLLQLKSEVSTLISDIETEINKRFALDPKLCIIAKNTDIEIPIVSFNKLDSVASRDSIFHHVEEVCGTSQLEEEYKYSVNISKYLNKELDGVEAKDTTVSEDLISTILDSILAEKNISITRNDASFVLKSLISKSTLERLYSKVEGAIDTKAGDITESFIGLLAFVNVFGPNLEKIEKTLLQNGISTDDIGNNTKIINELLDIAVYYIYYHRENTFIDTVLFSNKTKNPDMTNKVVENGISDNDIAMYVAYVFKDMPISKSGVTLTKLLEKKDIILAAYNKEKEADEIYILYKSKEITINVITMILDGYLSNDKNSTSRYFIEREYIKDISIEAIVYNYIINKKVTDDSLELLIYSKIGDEYIKLLKEENVNEVNINNTNICVYADIISTFMATMVYKEPTR